MVFGYIKTNISIPTGLYVPMEMLLNANYNSYIKVVEDGSAEMITVDYDNEKRTFPFKSEGPMINKRCNAIKEFIDAVAKDSEKDRIIFRGLTTLGTMEEVKDLYCFMLQKKVNAEFVDTPVVNIARYFGIMDRLPFQAQVLALEEIEFSYEREIALNELSWCESTPSLVCSQIDRKGKKRS